MQDIRRCINIDWLEVYCLEDSINFPHDAEYFRRCGFWVQKRDYGTRVYAEMFTIYGTDDLPLLEVRRKPKSVMGRETGGVMSEFACHIRLCNRTCYFEDAAGLLLQFCEQYGFAVQRISRLDLCLDFEKFDSGDEPQKFVTRYVAGKYSKINQAQVAMHGLDRWDGRAWNSIKWGQPTSMVTTKLYNKTMELSEVHDKPYIRQTWRAAGLIDDWHNCTKMDANGNPYKPTIWRLEFSVCSGTKNWFVVEDPYSTKKKLRSIRHTLDMYRTRRQMLDVFVSLCDHYFHFKYVEYKDTSRKLTKYALSAVALNYSNDLVKPPIIEEKERKRKDRCKDKQLFKFDAPATFYKVTHVATNKVQDRNALSLLRKLEQLRNTSLSAEVRRAATTIIEMLEYRMARNDYEVPWDDKQITLIRRLIAWRIKHHERPYADDLAYYRAMLELEDEFFMEHE